MRGGESWNFLVFKCNFDNYDIQRRLHSGHPFKLLHWFLYFNSSTFAIVIFYEIYFSLENKFKGTSSQEKLLVFVNLEL